MVNDIFDVLCCFLVEIEIGLQTLLVGWDLILFFLHETKNMKQL